MTRATPPHEAQYRDDILTLKGEYSIAIAVEPQLLEWVLLDVHGTPVWWKYASGDLEHELSPRIPRDEVVQHLASGEWKRIAICQDAKQHRERMLFTYGDQPVIPTYEETKLLEFIEKPDPDLVLPVFRLYDIVQDRVCEYPEDTGGGYTGVDYTAISHVWHQSSDTSLHAACERAHAATGQTHFWVDRWCIKQTSIEDKAFHVPRMRDYYTHAHSVLIIVPDLAIEPDAIPEEFVEALRRTKWFSRVWTFQEAMSSKRLMLDNGTHWSHQLVEGKTRQCHGERAKHRETIDGIALNDDLWIDAAGRLTMAISDILYSTGGRMWNLIVEDEKAKVSLTRLIHQTQYRRCRLEEDRFYGVMGMAHATDAVRVEYGIGFTQALLKAAASGALDSKILASSSVNSLNGACWLPDTADLGYRETLQQLSSQGRQTLTAGARGIVVWCRRKDSVTNVDATKGGEEDWVVEDNSHDRIVLKLVPQGDGMYHRIGSHVETHPVTVGEATALEVGFAVDLVG